MTLDAILVGLRALGQAGHYQAHCIEDSFADGRPTEMLKVVAWLQGFAAASEHIGKADLAAELADELDRERHALLADLIDRCRRKVTP